MRTRYDDSHSEEPEVTRRNHVLGLVAGIAAGVLALASLAFPWWTFEVQDVGTIHLYPWGAKGGWVAMGSYGYGVYLSLLLAFVGGLVSIVGEFRGDRKLNLKIGGILLVVSVAVFAISVQLWLRKIGGNVDWLFYSGDFGGGYSAHAALTVGFWMALVAAVLAFVSFFFHEEYYVPERS